MNKCNKCGKEIGAVSLSNQITGPYCDECWEKEVGQTSEEDDDFWKYALVIGTVTGLFVIKFLTNEYHVGLATVSAPRYGLATITAALGALSAWGVYRLKKRTRDAD